METLMMHYLTYVLERNLKSVEFLRHLRASALHSPDVIHPPDAVYPPDITPPNGKERVQ
jgi:hypothetical protein